MFDVQLQQEDNLENRMETITAGIDQMEPSTSIRETEIVPMEQNTIDDGANPPSTLVGTILSGSMQKVKFTFIFQYFIHSLNYIIHL